MLNRLLARKTDFSNDDHANGPGLRRTLGPWGITALGIGAVIGTGIFVVTGTAAAEHAGPAVLISFIIAAICSGFAALCCAEFATLIPISGSSYSYAYASLGELAAAFIGWNMVAEYGISASAVAASWTGYFAGLLDHMGVHLPVALTEAPLAFTNGQLVVTGHLFNLPAVAIVLALTWLCYIGIRESSTLNALMVLVKVGLIVIVVIAGYRYVNSENWHPFVREPRATASPARRASFAARPWCFSPTSASRPPPPRRRSARPHNATCRSASWCRW
ncbi:Amino acid permease OS=Rhodanobacter lindaniclasticus OX=75310 GN=B1991_17405 PE=4 SV=1 [Rhodanobacter lindaniclasticus]